MSLQAPSRTSTRGDRGRYVRADTAAAVVAIPAKDEADRIADCLLSLAQQTRRPDAVLLLVNNSRDETEAVARRLAGRLPYELHVVCHRFPPAIADAGHARGMAMNVAASLAGRDGVLLTTDADALPAPDWTEKSLAAIAAGADVVCGRVELNPADAALIPAHLHADDALECELIELLDRIAFSLDPLPSDPWPRHTEAAGASLAVTVAAFDLVNGIPALAVGEDRAFVGTLARVDARIRHDPAIRVVVSGRIEGRAFGGMADTIRRRMTRQDEFADDGVEPAADAYRRFDFRRRARLAWRAQRLKIDAFDNDLAADLSLSNASLRRILNDDYFGSAWAELEANSPLLVRRRVKFVELPKHIAYARELLMAQLQPEGDAWTSP